MPDFSAWAVAVLPHILAALLLLVAGSWLALRAEKVLVRFLEHHGIIDPTFRGVLTALVRYSILLLAVLASMQQLGVQTTSILAALGAILVAVGLALQGTLSNLAAGVMLLWLRPFRVGDEIETASVAGEVIEVGLFATEIHRTDGVYVFVPNSDLWSKPLSNLSRLPTRMVELKFTIKRIDDIQAVRDQLLSVATSETLVHKDPPPTIQAVGLTDSGLVLALQAWVDASHFRHASSHLAERTAAALLSSELNQSGASEPRSQ